MGIFTTSSIQDDILMWSHYSDSHKGFCVELQMENSGIAIVTQTRDDSSSYWLQPVEYEEGYPVFYH